MKLGTQILKMNHIYQTILSTLFCLQATCFVLQHFRPNYKEALRLSLLFYEAQRSGHLPKNNRIQWRRDSALNDRGYNGEDLTGGYYDATDYVKFSFTMAFTSTLLSWGAMDYKDAYINTDEYQNVLDAVKWATDYFIKCHVAPKELYGQVGNFTIDHEFWGRPEEMSLTRPVYKIDPEHPGSDLAGEVSAALSSASILFRNINKTYSEELLKHSKELFEFAKNYKGLFQDVLPGAKEYYASNGFGDELTWAAIWLYKATNDIHFLEQAERFYEKFGIANRPKEFFYNNKYAGIQILMAKEIREPKFVNPVRDFCNFNVDQQLKTGEGLLFINKVGTLSHAANVAFICLQAADMGLSEEKYRKFAKEQINYILGSEGRSFVVGYGRNFPTQPHHAASSCPDLPEPCGWERLKSTEPNPQILNGALVSGPDQNDFFDDSREEYLYTEVTIYSNAGFQSAVAGLIHLELQKL